MVRCCRRTDLTVCVDELATSDKISLHYSSVPTYTRASRKDLERRCRKYTRHETRQLRTEAPESSLACRCVEFLSHMPQWSLRVATSACEEFWPRDNWPEKALFTTAANHCHHPGATKISMRHNSTWLILGVSGGAPLSSRSVPCVCKGDMKGDMKTASMFPTQEGSAVHARLPQ